MNATTQETMVTFAKLDRLKEILREMGKVVVAYSGGADSTFLLKVGQEVLGKNILAVTATSETYPQAELEEAKRMTGLMGIRHQIIASEELDIPGFRANPTDRCYFCKKELFTKLSEVACQEGFQAVVDGSNYDDLGDHRPGMQAARELGVRSPLQEAQLTKEDVRAYSAQLGLSTWDKPSFACLSSRFPYGEEINEEKLRMVDQAEAFLRTQGFRQVRVRHHGTIARIEVDPGELNRFLEQDLTRETVAWLKKLGFTYVTLDLQGFRSGSMNEVLDQMETLIPTRKDFP